MFLGINDNAAAPYFNISSWFDPEHFIYTLGCIGYIALIIFFTFFYNNLFSNPVEIAEAVEKRGGTISDRHPGKETADFIRHESHKMLSVGCIFMIVIALLPMVLSGLCHVNGISFLGTSVLIITGTIVETYKALFADSLGISERKKLENGGLL